MVFGAEDARSISVIDQYNLSLVTCILAQGLITSHLASVCDAMVEQVLTSIKILKPSRPVGDCQHLISKEIKESI